MFYDHQQIAFLEKLNIVLWYFNKLFLSHSLLRAHLCKTSEAYFHKLLLL